MNFKNVLRAFMLGAMVGAVPMAPAFAETLRLAQGATQSALRVPLNRAIVLESDTPFAELSVANPLIADIATLSERTVYVLGKAPGRTTLTLLGPDGRLITNVEVRVTPDIAEFKERLRELLPNEHIEVRTANDGIVLSGTVSSTAKLQDALEVAERYAPERVLNLMSVGGVQQVMLQVRFAEMSRQVSKNLGSQTTIASNRATDGFLDVGEDGGFVSTLSDVPGANNLAVVGFDIGSTAVQLALEALETKGLVRTLAEPNVTALSGQPARFLAGGEYPIPVIGDGDDGTEVGVEYRPFGVELTFTPTVVDQDIINLQLDASVSALDQSVTTSINGAEVLGFSRRQTTTTVELRDGQSFAIGGLLQDEFRDSVNQVPWLGDVPVIGSLFRSSGYQRNQTELVVVITAHLVQPVSGAAIALPTDRIRPPTENELFLSGRLSGETSSTSRSARNAAADQDFSGNYGYVLE
ncbi:type II and III secretion system protein family protein [Jannaschia aquimarina]|uniref:PilQ protein n=1 Tax=Jannaschia aquimarina TaxID=935700 RepID=A0A0D1EL91_9RHOB|nr:type II and III secretion system protein family protein [Jannaschia aquimarina]KIT16535.1 Type IV pilus biogenesis and competence protein PilQ precursor [Jannaschia aquimarina]SNT06268.1 pilus assembly protein CpaC [Jannaschia aquimarina]